MKICYCAISGNSGGDSIKFPSTVEMPYRQYNRLCSDSIMLSPAMNHNENSLTTASISPKCKGENDFSRPWLCFNYVPTGFESSAHRGIASFLDSIKIDKPFPTFFFFFPRNLQRVLPSPDCVILRLWPFRSFAHTCSGGTAMEAVCGWSRNGSAEGKEGKMFQTLKKSPRTLSQTAAAPK